MTRGLSNRCNPARALGWNAPMPSSALLFPGQGSHAEGMEEPYRDHPVLECGLELLGYDPFERLSEGTRYQQPALFLCSVAAWQQWREEADDEDEARAAAGHSLGEYAALVAAGALRFDDAVRLVDERAAAMADAGDLNPGGMVAILGGDARGGRLGVGGASHPPLRNPAAGGFPGALGAPPIPGPQVPVSPTGPASP